MRADRMITMRTPRLLWAVPFVCVPLLGGLAAQEPTSGATPKFEVA